MSDTALSHVQRQGEDCSPFSWVPLAGSPLLLLWPRVLKPHFEDYSPHVKPVGRGAEVGVTGSPSPTSGTSAAGPCSHFPLPPGGPGHGILAGVRIDDSRSKNSSLHLKDQPRKGNSLASGVLLGAVRAGGALPDWRGRERYPVTKLPRYLFPEVAVYSA